VSWRVAVRHRTAYVYAGNVRWSYNEARVTPLTTDRQRVVDADVNISPGTRTYRYWDYWGTLVDSFDIHEPHEELVVTGSSVVETSAPEPPGNVGWDELAARPVRDGMAELLAPTRHVPVVDELAAVARTLAAAHAPAEACPAAVEWVRDRVGYEKGTTEVSTTAAQALALGSGVCQDFAHVTLSLLRSMSIPARYVSGYI
jgi:transglutaminase-like putative cysteine protease